MAQTLPLSTKWELILISTPNKRNCFLETVTLSCYCNVIRIRH